MRSFRAEINRVLRKKMEEVPNILLLGQSIRDPYGGAFKVTRGLTKDFDDRIIDLPISEAASVGLVQGLAYKGYIPILEIMFSDFLTLCTDQIYNGLVRLAHVHGFVHDLKVIIRVATGAGKRYGPTHSQNLEMLFLGCPGVTVYTPGLTTNLDTFYDKILEDCGISIVAEDKSLYDMKMIEWKDSNDSPTELNVVVPAYFGHHVIELAERCLIKPILLENMTFPGGFIVDNKPYLVISPYYDDIFIGHIVSSLKSFTGDVYALTPDCSFIPCSENESQIMITKEKIEERVKDILDGC